MLPSTRSTFQAGRASPSGLTTAWKLWTRPSALTKVPGVSVHGAIGSSTSLMSRLALNGLSVTTMPAPAQRLGARAGGGVELRLGVQQEQRLQAAGQHLARVQAALARQRVDQLRADGVGGLGRGSRRRRRSARRSIAPAPAAKSQSGGAPRRCPGRWPCARRTAAKRRCALAASVGVALQRRLRALLVADGGGDVGQRLHPLAGRHDASAGDGHRPVVGAVVHDRHLRAAAHRGAHAQREQRMVLAQVGADQQRALQRGQRRDAGAQPADALVACANSALRRR